MLSFRIGQRRDNFNVPQGTVLGPYAMAETGQGHIPPSVFIQVKRNAGTTAHSVTYEQSLSPTGPWTVQATIVDEAVLQLTKVTRYNRFVVGTATGGTVDVLCAPNMD